MSVQKATIAGNRVTIDVKLISSAVPILITTSNGPLVEISPTAC